MTEVRNDISSCDFFEPFFFGACVTSLRTNFYCQSPLVISLDDIILFRHVSF